MISQWARERRNAEQERDSDYGPEDYFEGALRNGRGAEKKNTMLADVIFIGVVLVGTVLFYIRFLRPGAVMFRDFGGEQDYNDDDEPAIAQNRGLYPPPGDPARDEWAVLR